MTTSRRDRGDRAERIGGALQGWASACIEGQRASPAAAKSWPAPHRIRREALRDRDRLAAAAPPIAGLDDVPYLTNETVFATAPCPAI